MYGNSSRNHVQANCVLLVIVFEIHLLWLCPVQASSLPPWPQQSTLSPTSGAELNSRVPAPVMVSSMIHGASNVPWVEVLAPRSVMPPLSTLIVAAAVTPALSRTKANAINSLTSRLILNPSGENLVSAAKNDPAARTRAF